MTTILYLSLALLHVLTERAQRILGTHKGASPLIAVHEPTLVPASKGYLAAFQAVQLHRTAKSAVMRRGRTSVNELVEGVHGWLGIVEHHLPDFALDVELDRESPDMVFAYAENLIAVIEEHRNELAFAPLLIEQVTALLVQARTDWAAAQQALGELQKLQQTLRELGVAMNRELVAFRRTLRNVLGTSHRDYQLLRTRRAVPEVEAASVPEQPAVEPTAPGNGATATTPRA
jgi:hypothetical protein